MHIREGGFRKIQKVHFVQLARAVNGVQVCANGLRAGGVVTWSELSHWYEHICSYCILTVGDTPSTDDQVFVCQLGSVIEVRCGARITIGYAFALFNGYRCNWYRWLAETWTRSTNYRERPID